MSTTPRPWVSAERNLCDIIAEFKNGKDSYWATVATVEKGYAESDDNAALIVQAVNAHDALCEALEGMIAVFDFKQPRRHPTETPSLEACSTALSNAKAALRQAER